MLYSSEKIFVEKLIACLKKNSIDAIPFDVKPFYDGVGRTEQLFRHMKTEMGEVADELSMLFIKNPFEQKYVHFRDVVAAEDGLVLSFDNPKHDKGRIALTDADADCILERLSLNISTECINRFAEAFCEGAC